MKTNKINVVLSLNKQTVTKLGNQNNSPGAQITGTLTSWVNQAVLHSGNCRVRERVSGVIDMHEAIAAVAKGDDYGC